MFATIGDTISSFLDSPVVLSAMFGIGAIAVALWLAGTWWAYLDISRRARSEFARFGVVSLILLSTPLMLPFSLLVYSLVRPQTTTSERRVLDLVGGLTPAMAGRLGCPECGAMVDPEWRRCPVCAAWLASECRACGEWSEPTADPCPWCAATKTEVPRSEPAVASAASRPARRVVAAPLRQDRTPVPPRLRRRGTGARHGGPVEAGS